MSPSSIEGSTATVEHSDNTSSLHRPGNLCGSVGCVHPMSSCLIARHHVLRTIVSPGDLGLSYEVSVAHDAWCARKPSRLFVNGRRRNTIGCFRAYSSNAEASWDSFSKEASPARHEVSALLRRILPFLPRALSASTSNGETQTSRLWSELLSEIDAGLSSSSVSDAHQSARVVGESFSRLFILTNSTRLF